jgi:hypothetical protein
LAKSCQKISKIFLKRVGEEEEEGEEREEGDL